MFRRLRGCEFRFFAGQVVGKRLLWLLEFLQLQAQIDCLEILGELLFECLVNFAVDRPVSQGIEFIDQRLVAFGGQACSDLVHQVDQMLVTVTQRAEEVVVGRQLLLGNHGIGVVEGSG